MIGMSSFFDTNVLLDHFLGRKNSFAASQLIDWVLKNKIQGTLASISLTNTWYILKTP
jgi:predicted nucleic acid-binding protein